MDEYELVAKAQKGDDSAFCQLIGLHKVQLYKIAYAYFRNEHDALDAVQETTYRAYLNIKKLKKAEYFRTWLIRILINYCNDQKRKDGKIVPLVEETPDDNTCLDDDKIEFQNLIYKLKPNHRQIIILKYYEDLTIKNIAEIMGRPEGTIKSWLNQALKSLKMMIEEEEEEHA